jgi:hypothetical protein
MVDEGVEAHSRSAASENACDRSGRQRLSGEKRAVGREGYAVGPLAGLGIDGDLPGVQIEQNDMKRPAGSQASGALIDVPEAWILRMFAGDGLPSTDRWSG